MIGINRFDVSIVHINAFTDDDKVILFDVIFLDYRSNPIEDNSSLIQWAYCSVLPYCE